MIAKYIKPAASLLFTIAVMLFWWLIHPEALSYQEQNQLFLFNSSYFITDMKVAGGLADYIGEFLVQFYYIIWLGAIMLALVFTLFQLSVWCVIKRECNEPQLWHYILSFLPPVMLLGLMGDENIILSYVVAIILALLVSLLPSPRKYVANCCFQVILVPILYWLIGPATWLYICIISIRKPKMLWTVAYMVLIQLLAYNTVLSQWPLETVFFGLNYYRIPLMTPIEMVALPVLILIIIAVAKKYTIAKNRSGMIASAVLIVLSAVSISQRYDKDKYALIRQDYLIRNEQWQQIITDAEKYQPEVNFSSEAVNLALAMTGQLADRMFTFYQSGTDALLMPMIRDNMSNLPTMEAFFRLGMVNESMRYAFDIQESILNARKSGRLTKRITECCIINGKSEVARKHLSLLKQSLFYRSWAKEAEGYIGNDMWVNNHPVWGKIRTLRYDDDFLYNYHEMDKMLGLLFIKNNKNRMALEYFLCQLLLNGNTATFMQYLPAAQQYGGYSYMPVTFKDAAQCIQAKGNLPGSAFAKYAQRMTQQKENEYEEASAH